MGNRSVTHATTGLQWTLGLTTKSIVSRTALLAVLFPLKIFSALKVGMRVLLNTKNQNVFGFDLSIKFVVRKKLP